MQIVYELRVNEEFSHLLFRADEGVLLGPRTRKVLIGGDDARLPMIGQLNRELRRTRGRSFFLGWSIEYKYTKKELSAAELFHLMITAAFEPAGEECGTTYDESNACRHVFEGPRDVGGPGKGYPRVTIPPTVCGAGRVQVSDLVLDLRKAPRARDIARTIADEWIVSQRLAVLMIDARLTGYELRRVRHKARYEDDPVDFSKVPSGHELLRRAAAAGLQSASWEFDVWLNRPEQDALAERARAEHAELLAQRIQRRGKPPPVWHQLIVTSRPARAVPPTRFGGQPFDDDTEGRGGRCPHGHIAGTNLLSELFLPRGDWDASDFVRTGELVGFRRGVLAPAPLLLISPRFRRLLIDNKIKGWRTEVAYLR
jgi:hypothetical protein